MRGRRTGRSPLRSTTRRALIFELYRTPASGSGALAASDDAFSLVDTQPASGPVFYRMGWIDLSTTEGVPEMIIAIQHGAGLPSAPLTLALRPLAPLQ